MAGIQKVTFVNPHYASYVGPLSEVSLPPLSLVNCATILQKHDFEVKVVDANILAMSASEAVQETQGSDVVVVTTSSLFSWQCPPLDITPFYDVVAALRKMKNPPFIIAVGPHSCTAPENLADAVDIVVLGQPEPLFNQMRSGMKPKDCISLDGIGFLRAGRYSSTPHTQDFSLARMPQPNLKLIPRDAYRLAVLPGSVMMLETSRGCPEKCAFCFQGMTHYSFDSKNLKQVVHEIEYVRSQLEIRNVFFIDLEINAAPEVFKGWMSEIVRQNLEISWSCQIRMSSLDEDALVQLMADSGCEVACIGLENIKEDALKHLFKNRPEAVVRERIRVLKKHGIKSLGFFLFGSVYDESEEDIRRTIAFARTSGLDFANFQIARPYPTTAFYNQSATYHSADIREGIPLAYEEHFTLQHLEKLRKEAYIRFYLRPQYVLRHLEQFTNPKEYLRNVKLFFRIVKKRAG